jgi:hypothetical protein
MKKRKFLIPIATLLSALSISNAEASLDKPLQVLNEKSAITSSSILEANNPFDFVMQQSGHTNVMAYHTSHASHSSHSSHRSHSSHYSSR